MFTPKFKAKAPTGSAFERSASTSDLDRPFVRRPTEAANRLYYRPNDAIYKARHEYMSEPDINHDHHSRKMAHISRQQYDGIGPVTNDGMPIILRSEVKAPHQHEWYKRLYQTIHKQKNNAGRQQYSKPNGYQSEPEPNYDSDYSVVKYRTLDRRRLEPATSTSNVRSNSYQSDKFYGTMPNPIKSGHPQYKNQPGRIENYTTGRSSVSEKEQKEWWDEVMDIFNGWLREHAIVPRIIIEFANGDKGIDHLEQTKLSPHYTEGNLSRALAKESGYTSDSNLVFRKKEVPLNSSPLSPVEQKQAYKSVQAGGEPPLFGFRKPAPEKPREYVEEVEYVRITPTLTRIRVNRKPTSPSTPEQKYSQKQDINKPDDDQPKKELTKLKAIRYRSPKKVMPSFIHIGSNDKVVVNQTPPPPPPNRKSSSSCVRSSTTVTLSGGRVPPKISSRHEKCFLSPEDPVPGGNKYGTITLRKRDQRQLSPTICRSKSAGAVSTLLSNLETSMRRNAAGPNIKRNDPLRMAQLHQHTRLRSLSPLRRQPRIATTNISTSRHSSRSPIAFGRSISRERTFAEEKKRLETTLPPSRTNFEASTNILRDPSLKSPQEVKQAVRSFATCPTHVRSKSVPRLHGASINSPRLTSVNTTMRHTMCFPQARPTALIEAPLPRTITTKTFNKPLAAAKNISTHSLARTNSTFSLESTNARVAQPPIKRNATGNVKVAARKPSGGGTIGTHKVRKPSIPAVALQTSKSESSIGRNLTSLNVKTTTTASVAVPPPPLDIDTVVWNDFNAHTHELTACKCSTNITVPEPPSDENGSEFGDGHYVDDLVWQYECKTNAEQPQRSKSPPRASTPASVQAPPLPPLPPPPPPSSLPLETGACGSNVSKPRQFSPTREIRVPQTPIQQQQTALLQQSANVRTVRSPSRRRIDSHRHNHSTSGGGGSQRGVIRASSLTSADDRSRRGLYLCGEHAHSATSLSHCDRHSPTCRYRNNSARFTDLNRFYNTLERVGQLERATSLTNFRPLRKESELLDFDEWRRVRLHERAERELHYLVGRLKQDQREKDLLYRSKDVDDIKWRRERDFGLHSKEKSVEDLREGFERQHLFSDSQQRLRDANHHRTHWRRNTVADLATNLELKLQNQQEKIDAYNTLPAQPPPPMQSATEPASLHLSSSVVSTLSKEQIRKITAQLNEIYSTGGRDLHEQQPDESYVVTVSSGHSNSVKPSSLKVRCNSSITKEELLGPVLRKRELLSNTSTLNRPKKPQDESTTIDEQAKSKSLARATSPIVLARETRGAIAAKNADVKLKKTVEPSHQAVPTISGQPTLGKVYDKQKLDEQAENITKKIQYFEDRQHDEPPKTIYHAREDSSPDEQEIMRLIEENMRTRAKERHQQKTQNGHIRAQPQPSDHRLHRTQHLSTSLTDLKEMLGERQTARHNCPHEHVTMDNVGERDDVEVVRIDDDDDDDDGCNADVVDVGTNVPGGVEDEADDDDLLEVARMAYELNEFSPDASLELYDTAYYRSRSLSPQSQTSNASGHPPYTGDVQKIRRHFESIGHSQQQQQSKQQQQQLKSTNPFFGISSLRKARSDTELNAELSPVSKDALTTTTTTTTTTAHQIEHDSSTDVFAIKRHYEQQQQQLRQEQAAEAVRSRARRRLPISPKGLGIRPSDIMGRRECAVRHKHLPRSRSRSSSDERAAATEQILLRRRRDYERSNTSPHLRRRSGVATSISSPDLHANTITFRSCRTPRRYDTTSNANASSLNECPVERRSHRLQRRPNSTSPPRPPKSVQHQACSTYTTLLRPRYGDIFANQKYDPKIHQPKARYVPDGAAPPPSTAAATSTTTTRRRRHTTHATQQPATSYEEVVKKSIAVTFQASEVPLPPPRHHIPLDPLPPPPRRHVSLDRFGLSTAMQAAEAPNRYLESDVNIHYKAPIRHEYKPPLADEELAFRQAEQMQKLYQEERRRKYLQELQDMNARRHTDNFTPSQKSPIALNRYDDFNSDLAPKSPNVPNYRKIAARALYNFQGQSARELTFKKGDIIYIRRQIDKNWYEGEHNAMVGLLPVNYVEVVNNSGGVGGGGVGGLKPQVKKPSEGQARAKYNFQAQSGVELSLNKGELVTLTRRVDDNWFEGKIANRKGIFPVTYVEVLTDIGADDNYQQHPTRTVITEHSTTTYRPTLDAMRTNINNEFNLITQNGQQPPNGILKETRSLQKTDILHVDTSTEPLTYRALYKYRPQNSDELELLEGDIVHVLEKCDDGWFVGTSQRNGCFGTFPGNYVERVI